MSAPQPLTCPSCGRRHAADERFCASCAMPLVHAVDGAGDEPRSDAHARARKVNPIYAEGALVRVAGGRHQAEAELIQGLLLEEGVPSILRRSPGFDVPDFLAAGPRDVLVPAAGAEVAREVLLQGDLAPPQRTGAEVPGAGHAVRLLAAILGGGAITALVTWGLLRLGA